MYWNGIESCNLNIEWKINNIEYQLVSTHSSSGQCFTFEWNIILVIWSALSAAMYFAQVLIPNVNGTLLRLLTRPKLWALSLFRTPNFILTTSLAAFTTLYPSILVPFNFTMGTDWYAQTDHWHVSDVHARARERESDCNSAHAHQIAYCKLHNKYQSYWKMNDVRASDNVDNDDDQR